MALNSGFWNSINRDRLYSAEDFSRLFDGLIEPGIFKEQYDAFSVALDSGTRVSVKKGIAYWNDKWIRNDSIETITLPAASAAGSCIDAVYVDVNHDDRESTIKYIRGAITTGTPVVPVVPASGMRLATILRPQNSTSIVTANITNTAGDALTPWVTSKLEAINLGNFTAQWEDMFNTWKASLVDQLTGANVTALNTKLNTIESGQVYSDVARQIYVQAATPPAAAPNGSIWVKV